MKDAVRAIVLTAFSVMMLLTVGLIGTVCYMAIEGIEVPEMLKTLATAASGFAFGTLAGMVKDYVGKASV